MLYSPSSPIAQVRASRGLTQRELAQAAGLSRETVCRIERGHRLPKLDVAARLARALNAPMVALLPIELDSTPLNGNEAPRQAPRCDDSRPVETADHERV